MKRTALILGAAITVAFAVSLLAQQVPAANGANYLGTWELASFKYGGATELSDYPKERRRLKMITATHFAWMDYDVQTKVVSSSAGGPYNLQGGAYTETIEFAGEGMETHLGQKQTFAIKVEGDKLSQSGKLSDGLKIEEIWQRVK